MESKPEVSATQKGERITFRMSFAESKVLLAKLEQTKIKKSEFARRAILGLPIHSATDHQMIGELRRLGALMKYQYPKESNWSDHEKKDYWQLMQRLNNLAALLQQNITRGE